MPASFRFDRVSRLALALVLALVVIAGATATRASAAPMQYVALGDSYSAASGVLPPDPTAPPQCLRSIRNYPHVIATAIAAQLRDVSCGGADTTDYFSPQYSGVPPQLDAVTSDTELVTQTIGGEEKHVLLDTVLRF